MHERRRCLTFLLLGFIWPDVLIMSRVRFRVNLHSVFARNFKDLLARSRRDIFLSVRLRTKWLWVGILLQPVGFIFGNIFGSKKNNFFCPVFVFHRGMSNGILKCILYFKNEGLNISWISRCNSIVVLKNGIYNTVFYSISSWT